MKKVKEQSLYALMCVGSKTRKSLSGAIKCSFATSELFWARVAKLGLNKKEVVPAWVIANAPAVLLNKKNGEPRALWTAWQVEQVVARFLNAK